MHISDGSHVVCPFAKCGKKFNSKPSFSLHMHRCHRNWSGKLISSAHVRHVTSNADTNMNAAVDYSVVDTECVMDEAGFETGDHSTLAGGQQDLKTLFTQNLALMYLKLQTKYLIPVSTIDMIIKDFKDIHKIGQTHIKNTLEYFAAKKHDCS
jgi:hypothetical protein